MVDDGVGTISAQADEPVTACFGEVPNGTPARREIVRRADGKLK
jgi:hypothetical protein